MDHPDLESADLSSIRTLTHIGASAPPTLRFAPVSASGRGSCTYGASEEGLVSVLTAAENDPANPGKPDREAIRALGRADVNKSMKT
jgi:fatty-acyl-CoA synthase